MALSCQLVLPSACRSASLLKAIVVGAVNVLATFVTVASVDNMGRRPLLIEGGIQMVLSLVSTHLVLYASCFIRPECCSMAAKP